MRPSGDRIAVRAWGLRRALAVAPGAAAIAVFAGCSGASASSDTVVSKDPTASDVTAYGDALAWSRKESGKRFWLVQRLDGSVKDAPVATSGRNYNPDLGPAQSDAPLAVYVRCEPPGSAACDVYELDLVAGREHKVDSISSSDRPESAPSTWRGNYAFGRLKLGSARDSGSGLFVERAGRVGKIDDRRPAGTDIDSRSVVFLDDHAGKGAKGREILVKPAAGRRACSLASGQVFSPVIDGGYAYWLEELRAGEFRIARAKLPHGRCAVEPDVVLSKRPLRGRAQSIAVTGGRFYYTNGTGVLRADHPVPRFG
jgi:hypothetical protein